jgi:uncharacterized metal-binding protein YceD (DUF177 family)
MPITINLRHLEADDLNLTGELPTEELDLDIRDEVVRLGDFLEYDLQVQKLEDELLVQGRLMLPLECQCVRCLKPFKYDLTLERWTRLLPLQGDETVPVVNDCVDLTPYLREDILLEFPQHPLCKRDGCGLPEASVGNTRDTSSRDSESSTSAWDALNKLKF